MATAHFYIPTTVSDAAKYFLNLFNLGYEQEQDGEPTPWPDPDDLTAWNEAWETSEQEVLPANEAVVKNYGPTVEEKTFGGVPVLDIKLKDWKDNGKVLVYTHGGAYTFLSAKSTKTNSVPVAHTTGLRVVSIDYTVAPKSKWNETIDQVIEAIQELIKQDGYKLEDIAMYGDSAGGGLTPGSILKMIDKGLGMPGAVVLMSPWTDITETGDTYQTLKEADPILTYPNCLANAAGAYAAPADQENPYVSPVYGDYSKGFPPTLIQYGTKEIFSSNAIRYYQKLYQAGIPVKIDPYEGMWHVFQSFLLPNTSLLMPESKVALDKMSVFLAERLKYKIPERPQLTAPAPIIGSISDLMAEAPKKVKRRSPSLLAGVFPE